MNDPLEIPVTEKSVGLINEGAGENSGGLIKEETDENSVGLVNEGTSENSSNSVDQVVKETVIENVLASNSVDQAVKETVIVKVLVNEGTSENPSNSVDQDVKETVIVIRSDGRGENGNKMEEEKVKTKDLEDEKNSCVIDVKSGSGASGSAGGGEGFERICRICQLIPEGLEKASIKETDLIQLGCGCKEGMSIVHSHCAETWFRLKGNRVCEICGEAAKNITGVRYHGHEEWDEVRLNGIPGSEASEGCWQGKPFCNFLMAVFVLAFILPWFLHVTWPF